MTITVTDIIAGPFYPNGVTTSFPFDFKIPSNSEIRVFTAADGEETTHDPGLYSVSIAGDGEGGTVAFSVAPTAALSPMFIILEPLFTQQSAYQNNGFLPSTLNPSFDRAAMRDLWLREQVLRSLRLPFGEDGGILPSVDDRKGKLLSFDPVTGAPDTSSFDAAIADAIAAINAGVAALVSQAQTAATTATTQAGVAAGHAAAAALSASVATAANTFRVSIAFATYPELAAITGTAAQSAGVFADTGTHTDPVVGGTVNNTGVFSYVVGVGWQRVGELTANRPDCIEVTQGPYFFGKAGNTPTQNSTALQAAIDYAIANGGNTIGRDMTLTFYGMTSAVNINLPGIVAKHNGTAYSAVTVHFEGPGGYNVDTMPAIVQTNGLLPCLIFHYSRACRVTGLAFKGAITANPSIGSLINNHEGATPWWNPTGAISTDPFCPHAAIVMDPFSSDSTTTYPGLSAYYLPTMGTAGSNTLTIEECTYSGFTVAEMYNCSRTANNGDGCVSRRNRYFRNKCCWANGHDQVRMNSLIDPFLNYCGTLIDTKSYGRGNGVMPEVRGGQSTICRQLFVGDGQRYGGSFIGHNTEEMWRLGQWGSGPSPLEFVGCQLKTFVYNTAPGYPAPDAWLHAQGQVNFVGGKIYTYDNLPDQLNLFINNGRVTFKGTALDMPFAVNVGGTNFKAPVQYYDCPAVSWTSGSAYGISNEYRGNYTDFSQRPQAMRPGVRFVEIDLNEANDYREWVSLGNEVITMDASVTITVNGDGTGSFTSGDSAKYIVGEYVHSDTAWTMSGFESVAGVTTGVTHRMNIGKVASVVGSTVNLINMPISLATGTFSVVLNRIGSMRPRAMVTLTSGSPTATISPTTGYSVGDRIRAAGIPSGAWVTGKSGGTLTLSHNATATDTSEAYDARMVLRGRRSYALGPPTGTWFKGDTLEVHNLDINSGSRASAAIRYRCVTGGTSPTWLTEYEGVPSATSSSTAYTPVIGDVGTRKRMTSGSAIGFTLPQDSDLNVPIGGFIEIEQAGAGTVTVSAGSGATVSSRGSLLASNGQYSVMRATKTAANTWSLSGDRA